MNAACRPQSRGAQRTPWCRFVAFFLVALSWSTVSSAADAAFDFGTLRERARQLAAGPYRSSEHNVPEVLRRLSYDQYRDIQFSRDEAIWRRDRLPFQLQFFHPGFLYNQPVDVWELVGNRARPIRFSTRMFKYGPTEVGELPDTLGFAGLRIHYPLNKPEDELAVFQGASYFRMLCRNAIYGLSARGLAIDTAEPQGEEFPTFEEFWVDRPARRAKEIRLYALLQSPSATGAYQFTITPGASTVAHIKAVVFLRRQPGVLGLAPLTSMFWYGENTARVPADFRPEVHDSDGLLVHTAAGEWLWRPLTNPTELRVASFGGESPRGFGLLQRDRRFESYEDLEAHYHARPSAWVEPIGDWGRGEVRLVEIPTKSETDDNIVAYWAPATLPAPGEALEFEYRLHWFLEGIGPPAGFVAATRQGEADPHQPQQRRFVVDFAGASLRNQKADTPIRPAVAVGEGAKLVHEPTVQKNPLTGAWRVSFVVEPDGTGRPVELRAFLAKSPHVLTETWSYLWSP